MVHISRAKGSPSPSFPLACAEENLEEVLVWLAQGAVTYIGGRLLSSVVDDSRLSDVNTLIRNAVSEIAVYTRRAIEENDVQQLVASMDSVKTNLRQYALFTTTHDQTANAFLLTDAVLKTSNAMSQCESLGISASLCCGCAVSLNIIAKFAYYKLAQVAEVRDTIVDTVNAATIYLNSLLPPFIAGLDPNRRISVPDPPCEWIDPPCDIDNAQTPYGQCWLIIDGQRTQVYDGLALGQSNWASIVTDYKRSAATFQQNAINAIQIPLQKAIVEWHSAIIGPPLVKALDG